MMANHKPDKIMWNGGTLQIEVGQFVTGRKALSRISGVPESSVEDILNFLENEQQIRQQKTTKFRLITIVNWVEYQSRSDNKATTKQQQADTNKKVKKERTISKTKVSQDMGWNNKSDNDDDLPSIGDDGEIKDVKKEAKVKDKELNDKFKQSIDWLIFHQGRDPKRTSIPSQLKAIQKLYTMGIGAKEAKGIILECEGETFWQSRKEKPDYWTAVAMVQKRG